MRIAVLHGSTREEGNTEALTEIVLDGLERTDIYLRGKTIRPIHDQRHEEGGFDPVDDDYDGIVQDVLEHDILVFTTPVYWYGPSGILKNFIDRWSQSLRDTRYNFKEAMAKKKAYVIVVGGDNPRIKALPLIQMLKYTFDFVGMPLEGYVIGKASRPGDIKGDSRALAEAQWLNRELKKEAGC
ncbi:flavodoxin family protein [Paenibacillus woosongensis]|uniref:Flavodoxin family protein n=1 Tax=Paenibacillus woosongensis TaxID=307580 RepID=A0AA95L216_9BACL|nr:flavodoxin family protein [Paenibacillus woosongensis]WHX49661.1 flavodoxin family protein [Paenibacillus woosongensis]